MLRVVDPHREEDIGLMVAVAGGDSAALGQLYDRYAPVMLAVAQRILRNPREAEDILHNVFLEAWSRAGDYDPERGSVRAWLILRMRSRSLDRVKSAGFSRARPLTDPEAALGPSEENPEVEADAQTLRGALRALPDEQREVLLLGYFEGLSSSEIASRLEIPIGTVKSRVSAAIGKLRALLEATS